MKKKKFKQLLLVIVIGIILISFLFYRVERYHSRIFKSTRYFSSSHSEKNFVSTPPMGWNSWNTMKGGVNDADIRQIADAMSTNGMRDAGYKYIIIDDGWALPKRTDGHLKPYPDRFPFGIKPLADYIHSKGLKFGIYSCRGRVTCVNQSAGSYGHEYTDAQDFASWGVDFLKYDNCYEAFLSDQEQDYKRMHDALLSSRRDIVFDICAWEFKKWMPSTGQLWRTSADIRNSWKSIMDTVDENEKSAQYAKPNKWNDSDMLVVGWANEPDTKNDSQIFSTTNPNNNGLTYEEYKAQFSLWAIMASPLIVGNDVRRMTSEIKQILLNSEVIAVDQDALGYQGIKVWEDKSGLQIYCKPLKGENAKAVVLLNRTSADNKITVQWQEIGLPAGKAFVRDLWIHRDLGIYSNNYESIVPSHGVVMLIVKSIGHEGK